MKTLIKTINLLSILLLFAISTQAENPVDNENATAYKKALTNQIQQLVQYPEFAKTNQAEGFVLVSFHFGENGSLSVIEVNSNNVELKNYVIQKLQTIELCTHAKNPKNIYNMRFDFKLI